MSSYRSHYLMGTSAQMGEDGKNMRVPNIAMKDLYALQDEFTKYLNPEEIVPRLLTRGLLSDSEVYMVRNPHMSPKQRIFELFQALANKGPNSPSKLLECLTERPIVQGHMYLASRLSGENKQDAVTVTSTFSEHRMNPVVLKKINNLKFKFADLLLETHQYLVKSKVSVEEFRIFVSFMSASTVNSSSLFFQDHLPSLSSAKTIDQIITIINENRYWNHFNYQLLEAVVRKFGDKTMQNKLEDYVDNVISFENTVSLSEYSLTVPKELTIPSKKDFVPMKSTLTSDKMWNSYSLAETRDLQKKMCEHMNIQEHALLFQGGEEGSVVITWLVPTSIQDSTFLHAQRKRSRLHRLGIFILEIDGTAIFMDEDQEDYQNTGSTLEWMEPTILSSLDSVERLVKDLTLSLQLHRQIMVERMSSGTRTGFTNDLLNDIRSDKSSSLPRMLRSASHNTPHQSLPHLHASNRSQSLTTPTTYRSTSRSRSPSPSTLTSLVPISRTTPEPAPKPILSRDDTDEKFDSGLSSIKTMRGDESELEHVAGWIKPDSGYSERYEWTSSST